MVQVLIRDDIHTIIDLCGDTFLYHFELWQKCEFLESMAVPSKISNTKNERIVY